MWSGTKDGDTTTAQTGGDESGGRRWGLMGGFGMNNSRHGADNSGSGNANANNANNSNSASSSAPPPPPPPQSSHSPPSPPHSVDGHSLAGTTVTTATSQTSHTTTSGSTTTHPRPVTPDKPVKDRRDHPARPSPTTTTSLQEALAAASVKVDDDINLNKAKSIEQQRRQLASSLLLDEERALSALTARRLDEERKLKVAESKRIVRIEEERRLKVAESARLREERRAAESMRKAEELMRIAEELKAFEEERAKKAEKERLNLEAELVASARALKAEDEKRAAAEARTLAAEQRKRKVEYEAQVLEEKRAAAAQALAEEEARRVEAEEKRVKAEREREEAEEKHRALEEKQAATARALSEESSEVERKKSKAEEERHMLDEERQRLEARQAALNAAEAEMEQRRVETERESRALEAKRSASTKALAAVDRETEQRKRHAEMECLRYEEKREAAAKSFAEEEAKRSEAEARRVEAEREQVEAEEEREILEKKREAAARALEAVVDARRAEADERKSLVEQKREMEKEMAASIAAADARRLEVEARLVAIETEQREREESEERMNALRTKLESEREASTRALIEQEKRTMEEEMAAAIAAANAARLEAEARLAAVEKEQRERQELQTLETEQSASAAVAAANAARLEAGVEVEPKDIVESEVRMKDLRQKWETEQAASARALEQEKREVEEEMAAAMAAANTALLEAEARLAAVEAEIEDKKRAEGEMNDLRSKLETEQAASARVLAAEESKRQEAEERTSKMEAEQQRLARELAALAEAVSCEDEKRKEAERMRLEAEQERLRLEERREAAAKAFAAEESRRLEAEARRLAAERTRREAEEEMAAAVTAASSTRLATKERPAVVEAETENKEQDSSEKITGQVGSTAVPAPEAKNVAEESHSIPTEPQVMNEKEEGMPEIAIASFSLEHKVAESDESDVIAQVQESQEYYRQRALFGPDESDTSDDMSGLTSASSAQLDSSGLAELNGAKAGFSANNAGLLQPSSQPECIDNVQAASALPQEQADNRCTSASKLLLQIHERRHRALCESGNEDAANLYAKAVRKESRARVADGAGEKPEYGPSLAAAAADSSSFRTDAEVTSDSDAGSNVEHNSSDEDLDNPDLWTKDSDEDCVQSGSVSEVSRDLVQPSPASCLAETSAGDNEKNNEVIRTVLLETNADDNGDLDEGKPDETRETEDGRKDNEKESTPLSPLESHLEYSSFCQSAESHSSSSSVTFSFGESAATPIKAAEEYPELLSHTNTGVYETQQMAEGKEIPLEKHYVFASPNPADLTSSTASPSPDAILLSASFDDSSVKSTSTVERLLRQSSHPSPQKSPEKALTPVVVLSQQEGELTFVNESVVTESADDSPLHQRLCEVNKYCPSVKRSEPINDDSQRLVMRDDDIEAEDEVKAEEASPESKGLAVPFGVASHVEAGEEGVDSRGNLVEEDGGKDDVEKGQMKTTEERMSNRRRSSCTKALLAILIAGVVGAGTYLGVRFLKPGNESPSVGTSSADFSESSTSMPTAMPTPMTTLEPTGEPTRLETGQPTLQPTVILTVASADPTHSPTSAPKEDVPLAGFAEHSTFSFYVMGDGPYSESELDTLTKQLNQLSVEADPDYDDDGAIFMIHLGDLLERRESVGNFVDDDEVAVVGDGAVLTCERRRYERVRNILLEHSSMPAFVLPGDDDWLECPTPDLAWQRWKDTFTGFEQNWSNSSAIPAMVERDDERIENFAFAHNGVLFIGVSVIRADDNLSAEKLQQAEDILQENAVWVEDQLDQYDFDDGSIRAVVMFGHAYWRNFLRDVRDALEATNVPVVYIHGNGKTFEAQTDFEEVGWYGFWDVQVDQMGIAPPMKITVQGTTDRANQNALTAESSDHVMAGSFIRLDRRGGTENGPLEYTQKFVATKELTFVGTCEDIGGCGLCQGDCDDDSGCGPGLKCYQRAGEEPVPGCEGLGSLSYDYCYSPEG